MNSIPVKNISTDTLGDQTPRKVWNIPGGVHPAENKEQSLKTPIKKALLPEYLIFPLSQHIGAPAQACVEVGERVLKGQKIAQAMGFVSVPIHASSSGEVVAIESRPIAHVSGLHDNCIVIKTDGLDESFPANAIEDFSSCDKSALLDHIRESGIAGMGGAGFPTAVKLGTAKPIETLIINATECEPYITADDALIRERSEEIIQGIKILQHILQPSKETLIGIEDNKPVAIEILKAACAVNADANIQVVVFPTKYPSGGEKQLIQILTGKEVANGSLPADIGITCQNIGTCVAIKQAVVDGRPLISRITTLTGDTLQPQNYEVALGTPIQELLKQSDYQAQASQPVIMGGPMMGFALADLNIPVVKTTNCILAPSVEELPPSPMAQACIRCGICAEACPVSLLPQQLYWFSRSQNSAQLENHNLFDCIECGACSYSCPSNIPLVQYYRSSKATIREEREDKIKSDKAKERFEVRQERLEREDREKEEKRKARKEAALKAKNSTDKQDIISAAIARTKEKNKEKIANKESTEVAAPENLDPASQAIERAKQKRSQPQENASEEDILKSQIETLEKRIAKAQDKMVVLEQTDSQKIDALKEGLKLQQVKLDAAKAQLILLQKNSGTTEIKNSVEETAEIDAAQAAILRAQQAQTTAATLTEAEKAEQQLVSINKRLLAQQEKYQSLLESDTEKAALIKVSLDKLEAKKSDLMRSTT